MLNQVNNYREEEALYIDFLLTQLRSLHSGLAVDTVSARVSLFIPYRIMLSNVQEWAKALALLLLLQPHISFWRVYCAFLKTLNAVESLNWTKILLVLNWALYLLTLFIIAGKCFKEVSRWFEPLIVKITAYRTWKIFTLLLSSDLIKELFTRHGHHRHDCNACYINNAHQ